MVIFRCVWPLWEHFKIMICVETIIVTLSRPYWLSIRDISINEILFCQKSNKKSNPTFPTFRLFQTFRLSVSTALEGTQWVHWKSLKDTFQNTDGAKHVLDPAKLFTDTELFSSLGLICPRQNGLIFTIQICDTVKLALCLPNLLTSIGDRTQVI